MREEILIIAGSKNDLPKLKELRSLFSKFKIEYSITIISSHRNLAALVKFLSQLPAKYTVIIGIATSVSNLPAIIGGYLKTTPITVMGVGISKTNLKGVDSLLSINSIPKGVPILNTGIDQTGLYNAGLAAIKILSRNDKGLQLKLKQILR